MFNGVLTRVEALNSLTRNGLEDRFSLHQGYGSLFTVDRDPGTNDGSWYGHKGQKRARRKLFGGDSSG
jgi:hypothetical protein